jgi:hypothetical protein
MNLLIVYISFWVFGALMLLLSGIGEGLKGESSRCLRRPSGLALYDRQNSGMMFICNDPF